MKFYSEKLDKLFDTPEQLSREEKDAEMIQSCKTCGPKETKQPSKKQLAADIDAAEEALKAAHCEYELAKQKVEALSQAYLEEVNAIIEPAKKKVREATANKYAAITNFNKEYGAYRKVYTGDKAAEEMARSLKQFSILDNYFKSLRWF